MDVVSGVASVAGILAFTGQAVNGLAKLSLILKDAAAAKDIVRDVLENVEALKATLEEVKRVIEVIDALPPQPFNGRMLLETGVLKHHTKDCSNDINKWIITARKLDPRSQSGIKAFLRKIKVATGKQDLHALGVAILGHQQRIGIGISLLGRSFDVLGIQHIQTMQTGLSGLTEAHLTLNNLINKSHTTHDNSWTEEKLTALIISQFESYRIFSENASNSSNQDISDSISSLASSVSQLADTFARRNDPEPCKDAENVSHTQNIVWSCDALTGVEQGFTGDECIYCGISMPDTKSNMDWLYRGYHLTKKHHFGTCNLEITFPSWSAMELHLSQFHCFNKDKQDHRTIARFSMSKRQSPIWERNEQNALQFDNILTETPERRFIIFNEIALEMQKAKCWDDHAQKLKVIQLVDFSDSEAYRNCLALLVQADEDSTMNFDLWIARSQIAYLIEGFFVEHKFLDFNRSTDFQGKALGVDVLTSMGSKLWMLMGIHGIREIERVQSIVTSPIFEPYFHMDPHLHNSVDAWLLDIFLQSSSVRAQVTQHFGQKSSEYSGVISQMSQILEFWHLDGVNAGSAATLLLSDGAIDSRDSIFAKNVPASYDGLNDEDYDYGDWCSGDGAPSSLGSGQSLASDLAAKRAPGKLVLPNGGIL